VLPAAGSRYLVPVALGVQSFLLDPPLFFLGGISREKKQFGGRSRGISRKPRDGSHRAGPEPLSRPAETAAAGGRRQGGVYMNYLGASGKFFPSLSVDFPTLSTGLWTSGRAGPPTLSWGGGRNVEGIQGPERVYGPVSGPIPEGCALSGEASLRRPWPLATGEASTTGKPVFSWGRDSTLDPRGPLSMGRGVSRASSLVSLVAKLEPPGPTSPRRKGPRRYR
jgi:hypothetical protein